jgi:long-chain acyl-CoA synthetase
MMLAHHLLGNAARRTPGKVALIAGDHSLSYADLERTSDRLAARLQRAGVARGDRVAVMLDNVPEAVVSLWGTLKAGAVYVPISPAAKADKLAHILADCEARCLVAPAALARRVASARAEAPSVAAILWVGEAGLSDLLADGDRVPADPGLIDHDLALLVYTSGSTGRPKGVMMTHAALANNAWAISTYLGNTPDDVVLCTLPLSFSYGLSQLLTAARVGFTVVLERSFAYPYEVLLQIGRRRVTGLPGVPTMFATLLQSAPFTGLDLSSLRYLTNAAAPLPPAHVRKLRAVLPDVALYSMYGLTECTRVSYLDPRRVDDKPGSVGRAMPNCEAYVAGDDGRKLPPGEVGELVVRGANLMQGYWKRPEETARALRPGPNPGETLLRTGDLFYADADGDLTFVGRQDDVFKSKGEKVSPYEVEAVLWEIDAVAEAAVIGVPDAIEGMAIKAFVVPRAGFALSQHDLRRHCQTRLEPQLVPKIFELCDALPKTESGKITRSLLRQTAG